MSSKVLPMPRLDAYSVGEYGETVRVFRLAAGGPFYYQIGDTRRVIKQNGKRIWNTKDAKQWARDRHRDFRSSSEPTLAAIFDLYLEHRSPVKATAQGKKDDIRRAEMWKAFLGPSRDPLSIGRGDIDSFIQKRGHSIIDAWGQDATLGRRNGNAKASTGWSPKRGRPAVRGVAESSARKDSDDAGAAQRNVCKSTRSVPGGGGQIKKSPLRLGRNAGGRMEDLVPTSGPGQSSSKNIIVRPRTVNADLQWLRGVLRWSLQDRCPVSAQDIAMRKIARELHQSAEPRRPVATQDRYEAIMAYLKENDDGRYGYLQALLVLVNGTGHRLSEVLSLRWADYHDYVMPHGAIQWRAENVGNKARLGRTVPVRIDVREALRRLKDERPGIGEAWLFPGLRDPKHATHRSVADKWLRQAEKAAGLPPLPGSLWHCYRRKWATERKHLPLADVAEAGGWKNARTLQTVYQQADSAGVLRVVLEAVELREAK